MTASEQNSSTRKRTIQRLLLVVGVILLVGLLAVIAVSPVPMRGAEVFGGLVNKIKGHPRATAFWTLGAGAALWLAIGMIAAVQEWRAARRELP